MHDTDIAGILYFARQFRFAHDALEDFLASFGLTFDYVFREQEFAFVIVHAESDYFLPLHVGNKLEIHLNIEMIGKSSFTVSYLIYKEDKTLTGSAKTVHVTVDRKTRKKVDIPEEFRKILQQHLKSNA